MKRIVTILTMLLTTGVFAQVNLSLNQTYDANVITGDAPLVFDDDVWTRWESGTYTGWVSVVFDNVASVDSMNFYYLATPGNTTTQEIYITNDGVNWNLHETINLVFNQTNMLYEPDSVSYIFPTPILSTKGIKVITTQNSSWVAWSEIKIWGSNCATSTLSSSMAPENITCNSLNNGNATVYPTGGNSDYTYNWSNNETTQTIVGLSPNTYTVTVTDATGCTVTESVTITEPGAIAVTEDTTHYEVDATTFMNISPATYLDSTKTRQTVVNGCDSVVNYYSNFIYSATYCTDTTEVMDTTFVTVTDTTFVTETIYDTVLVSVEDTLNIDVALSLPAPNNLNTILVYPNPAKTNITIDNGTFGNMTGYSITIVNTLGQVMFDETINQQTFDIDISSWDGGTYFLNIIDGGSNTIDTRKIVKY